MTSRRNTFVVPKGLIDDLASLTDKDREAIASFLQKLLDNPYSMVEEAHASGEYFASLILDNRYVLYWSLEYPDNLTLTGPLKIKLLVLKNAAELSRTPSVGESK